MCRSRLLPPRKGEFMRTRYWVYLGVVVLAAAVLIPLMRETSSAGGQMWHAAPFLGSILIAVGWVVTSEVNIKSSQRQHTIVLITQHLLDPNRALNRATIKTVLPTHDTKFTPQMVPFDNETHEVIKALDVELNFYEFIAAGARRYDLDEKLLKQCLRGMFCNFHEQCKDYIAYWRNKSPTIWCEITWLRRRWDRIGISERIRICLYGPKR